MPRDNFSQERSILNDHVYRAYQNILSTEPWRNLSEVPTGEEILPRTGPSMINTIVEDWDAYQKEAEYYPNLPHNIIDGPWQSKEEYVRAHYEMNRQDAIAPLQQSVLAFKRNPTMKEDNDTAIYTQVTFKGILMSRMGAAFRVEFSNERSEKQIRWKQSKRLVQGTIVALTPHNDMFNKICKIAVVAARPIEGGLDQNPPQIDLFWGDLEEAVFDPVEKYIMVEARSGYFEASRHMLVAMQKLMTEKFALAKHIVELEPNVGAPPFLERHPWMNLNSLVRADIMEKENAAGFVHEEEALDNVDVLEAWPFIPYTDMDLSQKQACQSMLTMQLAIVQGPPGTGKTFVSVSSLRVMLENWVEGDPPIIVSAQTNHALDQLLTHIMTHEPNIVRLGGRSDPENKAIIARTLHQLRTNPAKGTPVTPPDSSFGYARREFEDRNGEMMEGLELLITAGIIPANLFLSYGIVTKAQVASLSEDGWSGGNDQGETDLATWLGDDQIVRIPGATPVNEGLPMEESDIEFEQLQELEQEMANDAREGDGDNLAGHWIPFQRFLTGRHGLLVDKAQIKKLARKKDLFAIPRGHRGEVYRYWESQLNEKLLKTLRAQLKKHDRTVGEYQVIKWVAAIKFMKNLGIKLIGCTTTGLSKYRGLLAALQPRTMLIEEAAETLEATIIAGMLDSLEQLILVGDHQQLQANCNIRALEGAPHHLNVSMFERLVNNNIGYIMLKQQRRMITDVRQLLTIEDNPFYKELVDHASVWDREFNRPPIPGMGGKDTYFFNHNWPEARNADLSMYNKYEAEMIAGFFHYLTLNGVDHEKITVLTFYNGQRKTILRELKAYPGLENCSYFKVHTVDSYQGEENDIILLSLVRSNSNMGVGFLENKNRLVVALSRARRGLYLFGNSVTLTVGESDGDCVGREKLWYPLINEMKTQRRYDLDGGLPITCSKHNTTIRLYEPGHWVGRAGGCDLKCQGILPCGHDCQYTCHPFSHEKIYCRVACPRLVTTCGHACSGTCGQLCFCEMCKQAFHEQVENMQSRADIRHLDIFDDQPQTLRNISSATQIGLIAPTAKATNLEIPLAKAKTKEWQEWNAKKADQEQARQLALQDTIQTSANRGDIVLKELYRPVTLDDDGQREKRVRKIVRETRVLQRAEEVVEDVSPHSQVTHGVRAIEGISSNDGQITSELSDVFDGLNMTAWERGKIAPCVPKIEDASQCRMMPPPGLSNPSLIRGTRENSASQDFSQSSLVDYKQPKAVLAPSTNKQVLQVAQSGTKLLKRVVDANKYEPTPMDWLDDDEVSCVGGTATALPVKAATDDTEDLICFD